MSRVTPVNKGFDAESSRAYPIIVNCIHLIQLLLRLRKVLLFVKKKRKVLLSGIYEIKLNTLLYLPLIPKFELWIYFWQSKGCPISFFDEKGAQLVIVIVIVKYKIPILKFN